MRKIWLCAVALGLSALPALAQEKDRRSETPSSSSGSVRSELRFFDAEQEPAARDERPHIQVLKHPYDIASFYRSPGGARGFSYGSASSDPYGLYSDHSNDSGVPPAWFRPDMRRRSMSLDWAREFDGGWRWDARNNRWSFDRRRSDSRPRPAPSRP